MSEQVKRYYTDCNNLSNIDNPRDECDVMVVLASDYATLQAENQRLTEALQNANQSSGAEAYGIACEELEAYQRKRAAQGKDAGTECSLVDGMGSIFSMLDSAEAECERWQVYVCRCDSCGKMKKFTSR